MEIKQISKVQENLTKVMVQGLVSVLVDAGFNEEAAVEMMVEMERRMTTSMHWLPMTPDAVFEDDGDYLLQHIRTLDDVDIGLFVGYYKDGLFHNDGSGHKQEPRYFSHYARITEPK